ncbi:hypothetical protein NG895_26010 [Aeoliella sp. ICT_H6.2]|uniref:Uncharacterized protein n=1 Tax=Aeoliella straminimaris TaxID=2954799 RepID=A0A9X2FE09_9BACT|nr:hypothetical protein [Aeoliella straminimaris]MCO6047372.1 hypothetical protein [Aeoliella straminimaris]
MGRAYAGVLGYLAAAVTFTRGVIASGGVEGTVLSAVAAMAIFAVIGFVLGTIAQATVDRSVREQFELQVQADSSTPAS